MVNDAQRWIDAYGDAWRRKDSEAVAQLFTADARYQSSPFRPPHLGREEIAAYWQQATEHQAEFSIEFGQPFVADQHVTVEWWARMRDADWADAMDADDDHITLPGCLILRFDDQGLCEELREYWHVEFGPWRSPPEGWGL